MTDKIVFVIIVKFPEILEVVKFAFPNVHHVIHRIVFARETLPIRSVRRESIFLLWPVSDIVKLVVVIALLLLYHRHIELSKG